MSKSGRVALTKVREWLGVVWRPSQRFGSGREWREALLEVQKWSGVVGRPSQRSGSGRVALPKVREWLEVPSGGPGVVGSPS